MALVTAIVDTDIVAANSRGSTNSLLHAVFYSQLVGLYPNIAKTLRHLSAQLVATNAQEISDGGVAEDPLSSCGGCFDLEPLVGNKASAAEVDAGSITCRVQCLCRRGDV